MLTRGIALALPVPSVEVINDPPRRELRKRLHAAMPRRARKDLERTIQDLGIIPRADRGHDRARRRRPAQPHNSGGHALASKDPALGPLPRLT
jgi:hypothetical protein